MLPYIRWKRHGAIKTPDHTLTVILRFCFRFFNFFLCIVCWGSEIIYCHEYKWAHTKRIRIYIICNLQMCLYLTCTCCRTLSFNYLLINVLPLLSEERFLNFFKIITSVQNLIVYKLELNLPTAQGLRNSPNTHSSFSSNKVWENICFLTNVFCVYVDFYMYSAFK